MHLFGAASADEIIGKSIYDIHPVEFHKKLQARLQYVQETGLSALSTEYKLIRLDDELIDVETASTQMNHKNRPAVLSLYRDISDRKQAEEALQESEQRDRSLTANLNVGVYRNTTGPTGKFIEANPAIVKMFGYDSRDEFLSVSVSDLYKNPEDRKE